MLSSSQINQQVTDGARRLLARATDNRSLTVASFVPRIRSAVDKYLLRAEPDAPAKSIADFVDGLQADDLCLIVACEGGDQNAWNDLVERFSATVRSAARSASANEDTAEDLTQSIWGELYGLREREDGRPAGKLLYYSGRGSLAGWLRAVVAQLAVDQHRKQSRLVQTEQDADLDRLAQDAAAKHEAFHGSGTILNPEESVANSIAGAEMQKALARSIGNLSGQDRLLVKLYYFDDLRLREAGAVLGVHEATASRRLTRIHNDLRKDVEQILINECGWTKAETDRCFAELAINLQTDVESILAADDRAENQSGVRG